jgi:hypothetical protein
MDADYQQYCEGRMALTLAGNLAMRRAVQGSTPGWRRVRTCRELIALHEAGHAVIAAAVGFHVHRVFIVSVAESNRSGFAGCCVATFRPEEAPGDDLPPIQKMRSDRHVAADLCWHLALLAGDAASWRAALKQYRLWLAKVRDLIERHWLAIMNLAEQLERREDLSGAEVAGILDHSTLRRQPGISTSGEPL